jgi:hypothetical protein
MSFEVSADGYLRGSGLRTLNLAMFFVVVRATSVIRVSPS